MDRADVTQILQMRNPGAASGTVAFTAVVLVFDITVQMWSFASKLDTLFLKVS